MNNWVEEIKERKSWGKAPNVWYIIGWYEEEKAAFNAAEAEWNRRQEEGWRKEGETHDMQSLQALADGDGNLIMYDDYFHWNVEGPHWYLHKDGKWEKMLCKVGSFRPNPSDLMYGEYRSKKEAETRLNKSSFRPARFEGYLEHLQNAEPPYSCRERN